MSSSPTDHRWREVLMPQMGVSVAEGTIVEWRKSAGRRRRGRRDARRRHDRQGGRGDPLSGVGCRWARSWSRRARPWLSGTPIATIQQGTRSPAGPVDGEGAPRTSDPIVRLRGYPVAPPPADEADRSTFYSPVVRRIADEHGVDLEQVEGTGIGGRVRKRDVVAFVENGAPERRPRPSGRCTPSRRTSQSPPLRMGMAMRRCRASRADVGDAAGDRAAHGRQPADGRPLHDDRRGRLQPGRRRAGGAEGGDGPPGRVAHLPGFVAPATVEALREFPILNASLDGDEVVYHDDVNLGIAVALDEGLIVPVIPKAQRLSLEGHGRGDRGGRRAGAGRAARARRRPRRHVHDHQPGPVRRGDRDADHQPAAGGDPRPGGDRQAAGRGRATAPTRSRSGRWPTCRCRSTIARSTARPRPGSWRGSRDRLEGWEAG